MKKLLLAFLCYSGLYAQSPTLTLCDYMENGFASFDLTSANQELLNGSAADDFTITYFETQLDAQNNVNAISNPAQYTNIHPSSQDISVRVTNNVSSEVDFAVIHLLVNPLPNNELFYVEIPDTDSVPSDGNFVFPLSLVSTPILEANSDINAEVHFFADSALTTTIPDPYTIIGGSGGFYSVITNTDTGCVAVKNFQVLITDGTLNLKGSVWANLKAYPNPVKDELNIDFVGEVEAITITNSLGQTVGVYRTNQIDVSALNSGIYFVTVSSLSGAKTIKVIKT